MSQDQPTVPCKFCGHYTSFTATEECTGCHEVVIRLKDFLKSREARVHTLMLLAEVMAAKETR